MPKIVWRTCHAVTFTGTLPDLSSNSRVAKWRHCTLQLTTKAGRTQLPRFHLYRDIKAISNSQHFLLYTAFLIIFFMPSFLSFLLKYLNPVCPFLINMNLILFGSIHILMPSLFERDKWEKGSVFPSVPNFFSTLIERMSNQFGVFSLQ